MTPSKGLHHQAPGSSLGPLVSCQDAVLDTLWLLFYTTEPGAVNAPRAYGAAGV
jgi:hypothetical protein